MESMCYWCECLWQNLTALSRNGELCLSASAGLVPFSFICASRDCTCESAQCWTFVTRRSFAVVVSSVTEVRRSEVMKSRRRGDREKNQLGADVTASAARRRATHGGEGDYGVYELTVSDVASP